jgi:predicted transcriptional regulator
MAGITRTNPTAVALGTIQRNNSQTVYKVVLAGGNGLGTMTDAAGAAKVTDALGSFCGTIQAVDATNLLVVADRHAVSIGAVATAIAKVLDTGTFTVSGGVATLSDTDTVTVTEPTSLAGM